MPENKLAYNQAVFYSQAIADLFYGVMESGRPADVELRSFFYRNKRCGSRDRKFISEGLYSLFRWYGWLKGMVPPHKATRAIDDVRFCRALAVSLNLDGFTSPLPYKIICELSGHTEVAFAAKLVEAKDQVQRITGKSLSLEDLVPGWFLAAAEKLDEDFYEALQKRPPVWLRVQNNGFDKVVEELQKNEIHFGVYSPVPNAIRIDGKVNLVALQSFRDGLFEVQDLASQCVVEVCDVKKDEVWWDVCAGSGGKSLGLADKLGKSGQVQASDKRSVVLKEVRKRATRGKFSNIQTVDLAKEKRSLRQFDGVLVDAPCSCTGTWRRNPDSRWTKEADVCQHWAQVQLQILNEVAGKVRKGGKLVYATCAATKIENEDVVRDFLAGNEEYILEPFENILTGENTVGLMKIKAWPADCNEMFVASLIRQKK